MKRIIAFVLALCGLLSVGVSSSAVGTTEITQPGKATVGIEAIFAGTKFRVTVPTLFQFCVKEDGSTMTANGFSVENFSSGPVEVKRVEAMGNGWNIVDGNTDFSSLPIDSRAFTMSMYKEGEKKKEYDSFPAAMSGSLSILPKKSAIRSTVIDGLKNLDLVYDGQFAPQSEPIHTLVRAADIVFVVGWHTA